MSEQNQVAIVPVTFGELREMAETMASSGMFGKNPAQMMSLMLIAQAENLHPAIAAMEYDVIQGRPSLKGQAALARFQQASGSVEWKVRTDTEARAVFTHPKGGSLEVSWTMEKARKMGLDQKDNWKKQPGVMLTWRCVAEGVRAVYPACLNRMYLSEEVQDFEPLRDVSPEKKPAPAKKHDSPAPEINPVKAEQDNAPDGQSWEAKAAELTAKHGIDKAMKSAMWNDCGKNAKAYCEKVIAVMESAPPASDREVPPTDQDLFGNGTSPDDIIIELESWSCANNIEPALKAEIVSALNRNERNMAILNGLLDRAINQK